MCNRYAHKIPREEWKLHFGIEPPAELPGAHFARYNVAPTQEVPDIVSRARVGAVPEFALLVWGFAWDDSSIGVHYNARSETARAVALSASLHPSCRPPCKAPAPPFHPPKKVPCSLPPSGLKVVSIGCELFARQFHNSL
jgi:hypothetical protein